MANKIQSVVKQIWPGVRGVLILTVLFLAGEWLGGFIAFPVPGAVVGMILIFSLLQLHIIPLSWVDQGSVWLLSFMGLFYVPFGVGIMESGDLIGRWGIQVLIIVVMTVCAVFAVSTWTFQKLAEKSNPSDE